MAIASVFTCTSPVAPHPVAANFSAKNWFCFLWSLAGFGTACLQCSLGLGTLQLINMYFATAVITFLYWKQSIIWVCLCKGFSNTSLYTHLIPCPNKFVTESLLATSSAAWCYWQEFPLVCLLRNAWWLELGKRGEYTVSQGINKVFPLFCCYFLSILDPSPFNNCVSKYSNSAPKFLVYLLLVGLTIPWK